MIKYFSGVRSSSDEMIPGSPGMKSSPADFIPETPAIKSTPADCTSDLPFICTACEYVCKNVLKILFAHKNDRY